MPAAAEICAALLLAAGVTWLAVPPVRRLAVRTDFLDHPVGYKQHGRSTPYLGGLAVMLGFLAAAIPFGGALSDYLPLTLCAIGLWAVGTVDDKVGLGIGIRLAAQLAAAAALWSWGAGWGIAFEPADAALTVLWVLGVTNAFNLMDNIDGATGTVGAISALGVGVVSLALGNELLGAFAFALAGACAGFLPHNLSKPSRIFLGDGGSMPIGFLIAATALVGADDSLGWRSVLAAAPLVALPIFDTTLVVMSRMRRGVMVLSGGRDHLTHRLLKKLPSERRVCAVLALAQALFCALALGLQGMDESWVVACAGLYVAAGALAVALIDGYSPGHWAEEPT